MINLLKSVVAILLGLAALSCVLVATQMLSDRFYVPWPPFSSAEMIVTAVRWLGATLVGAYLAARVAPRLPTAHAFVCSLLFFALMLRVIIASNLHYFGTIYLCSVLVLILCMGLLAGQVRVWLLSKRMVGSDGT